MDFSLIVRYLSGYDKKLKVISDKMDALAERVETLGQAGPEVYK